MDSASLSLTWVDVGAIATMLAFAISGMLKYVNGRDGDIRQNLNNHRQRMDALELASNNKLERIARMEAFMETYKADQARIEAKLDQVLNRLK